MSKENKSSVEGNFDAMFDEFSSEWTEPSKKANEFNPKLPELPLLDNFEVDSEVSKYEENDTAIEHEEFDESVELDINKKESISLEDEDLVYNEEDLRYYDDGDFEPITSYDEEEVRIQEEEYNSSLLNAEDEEFEDFEKFEEYEEFEKDEDFEEEEMYEYYEEDHDEEFIPSSILPGIGDKKQEGNKGEKEDYSKDKRKDNQVDANQKAEELFASIKNKIANLFKKGKVVNQGHNGGNKKKDKQKMKSSSKKVNLKNFTKKQKVIALVILVSLFTVVSFVSYTAFSYKSIDEVNKAVSFKDDNDENISFEIKDLKIEEKKLNGSVSNTSDFSSNISIKVELEEKSFNIFKKKRIECESDIVNLEGSSNVEFSCKKKVDKEKKYKINVETESF